MTLLNSEPMAAQMACICAIEQVPGQAGLASPEAQADAGTELGLVLALEAKVVTGVGWWRLQTRAPSAP